MVAGFANMKALSTRNGDPARASRPFDQDRDGFVMGEGATYLILESRAHAEARGAKILAIFSGYGRRASVSRIPSRAAQPWPVYFDWATT